VTLIRLGVGSPPRNRTADGKEGKKGVNGREREAF